MANLVDESAQLIEALRSPRAYPHPVGDIEVLETHISWVLLTGECAYKLKKPVDMGFLDFTTLRRRQFYCEEELRLNRRLAPQLYLEVVPITGTPQFPTVGGQGEPIEYALQMRQFPQSALLGNALARGELLPRHIDSLARQLADFHTAAAQAPAGGKLGAWDSLRESLEETAADLEFEPADAAAADRLRVWCRRELEWRRASLAERQQQGFVRECHGDLHLGNMLLWDDEPLIFDCIEFNDRFRWIDVMSELAFAVMDLEDRGSPALARRLLNRYLEHTGDYEGLRVLRYYLVYRAVVRAKVACLRLRQMPVDATGRSAQEAEYRGYLALAERFCRSSEPMLIITHGLSGSGKTTLTSALVESMDAIRIRSDLERKRLFGLQPLERSKSSLSDRIYSAEATERTYTRLAELAGVVLDSGYSVIVDAAFLERNRRKVFRQLAAAHHVPFRTLDIQTNPEILRRRVADRAREGSDASEADLTVLEGQLRSAEPLDAGEQAGLIPIDGEAPPPASDIAARLMEGH